MAVWLFSRGTNKGVSNNAETIQRNWINLSASSTQFSVFLPSKNAHTSHRERDLPE